MYQNGTCNQDLDPKYWLGACRKRDLAVRTFELSDCMECCKEFIINAVALFFFQKMDTGFGIVDLPLRKKRLRHKLSSGHSRNVGSWSLKERKKAAKWLRMIKVQMRVVIHSSFEHSDEEEQILLDMLGVYLVMTRVPQVRI